jgi:hypothetical protein
VVKAQDVTDPKCCNDVVEGKVKVRDIHTVDVGS